MKYVLILAGGVGRRMGNTSVPKQFIMIDDIPIILYTIKQFYVVPYFNKIIVVIPEDYKKYLDDLLKKNNYSNVITVVGGDTRYESILKGCTFIKEKLKNDEKTIVVSHDAVRPFVSRSIIDENVNLMNHYCAVDTILPVNDTIIELDAGRVVNILDKKILFRSQTPQTFRLHEFMNLCSELTSEETMKLADACKIYYIKNIDVGKAVGDESNFKITTPFDLDVARSLVKKFRK